MEKTYQRQTWEDNFGSDYLQRNIYSPEQLDEFYKNRYGYSRTQLNNQFLKDISKDAKILEVGTNIGNQLLHLQNMGFKNLYGIEIQNRAINYAKKRADNLNIIKGDALDIPFKDNFFDVVFTSGVLIHISPKNINFAIDEIYRVSNSYIWGFEYYADEYIDLMYQGNKDLMWKANFMKIYQERKQNLRKIDELKVSYSDDKNLLDQMFLLKK
ncbi:methyltransferase type 11 [Malaciobacter molluscorum LMG 25693]|uniref:Methyltransferase n=1 Tax=Malaciobacter molluscorum LMG 25693 TaxID=870501 RepID=A0A2G1DFN0_9BACT|nr:pseudaminic acid biosynthesis-associated methylase [Malaciobacter molluscorum]AXX93550.1 methyltransferase [Malaciobacter molluscorum LMG 25693]PHO17295.1 methyltransferase type 11 [Malaciobacter molluscorum LMG 25693]